jgi:hypothetical protein
MPHSPTCTGCYQCDPEMRAAMRAFARGDYETYCRWLSRQNLRAASSRGELRTNVHQPENTMTTVDLHRAIEQRLRRTLPRTQAFMRIISADAEKGTGRVEVYEDGRTRTIPFTFELDGETVVIKNLKTLEHYTPPNPYTEGVATLRAAMETPESKAEDAYRESRRRELADEPVALATLRTAHQARTARINATDLDRFAPPDPWAAPVRALQEKERGR